LPYLLKTYNILAFITAILYVLLLSQVLPKFAGMGHILVTRFSTQGVQLLGLSLAIMVWCAFTAWELHRTNIVQTHYAINIAYFCVKFIFLGPAATLAMMWKWHEIAMERSRGRDMARIPRADQHGQSRVNIQKPGAVGRS
jgi:hypothetical protein